MPNPTVEIAGVDRTDKHVINSLTLRRSINDRSRLTCELMEPLGVYRPVPGNEITIDQMVVESSPGSTVRRFGGYIEQVEERFVPGTFHDARPGTLGYRLDCVDYTRLLDWRLYAGSFDAGVMFGDVIQAIFDAKLAGDGVTLGADIPTGPALSARLQDGLRPISEWFRKLATDTGYLFRIDENKVLRFGPLATSPPNPAPFSLTFGSLNWHNLKITKRLGEYRNRQYVRTEYTVTGELTKQFTGDGTTADFFQFDGPFWEAPAVTLDAVPLTVGRFGFDGAGFDCYYDVEGWGLHFVALLGNSPPANGEILELAYRVRFQNYTVQEDAVEIAARAAIQGDSGIIEAIHEDRYIDSKAALDARATALLRQYGAVPTLLEFECDSRTEPASDSLDPGMLLDVDLTDGPSVVNDSFTVESIESKWVKVATGDIWKHRIQCTDQEPHGIRPTGGRGGSTTVVIERLAEAVRIGPDVPTLTTESPASSTDVIVQQTITANTTIGAPTDVADGGEIEYQLTQGGSPFGGWVVSWNSVFKGVNSSTVQPDGGLTTIIRFRRVGTSFLMLFNSGGMEL